MGIVFFLLLVACEESITYDASSEEDQLLVIEGRITNENKAHLIRVTRTDDYFSNVEESAAVIESIEILEVGTGTYYEVSAVDTGIGYYKSQVFTGIVDEEYQLWLTYDNEKYVASAILNAVGEMDSISVEYEYVTYFGGQGSYEINMYAFEPDPVGDYYMMNLYVNDILYNSRFDLTVYFDDEVINGTYFEGITMYNLPQEEISLDTNIIRLEMLSISRDEYNFNDSFLEETEFSGSIFSGPAADVPSNLESIESDKTGLGFFAASSITSVETVLYKVHDESTNDPDYKK